MPSNFIEPVRVIRSSGDLTSFLESSAYTEYVDFVVALSDSVRGVKTTDTFPVSKVCVKIVELLDTLRGYIILCPPIETQSRFGNASFRKWIEMVNQEIEALLSDWVPAESLVEIKVYICSSFGDKDRIDYGTGHEASFICWLFCLRKLGILHEEDFTAVVLRGFIKYIDLMYELQTTYWLEPAGSHGVWGLDDYHFLPFYFGSSQLIGQRYIRPRAIHQADILEECSKDYLYLRTIENVNKVKTESLAWHSPMLNDVSSVKTWEKINSGLLKMYKAEVLGKLPIMQHFLFGSILSFQSTAPLCTEEDLEEERRAQNYAAGCCAGIHIPSAHGQLHNASASRPHNHSTPLIPFD
eukprot:CFRG3907T1